MTNRLRLTMLALTMATSALICPKATRAVALVTSFNPGLGSLEAIAYDPVAGTLFLFHDGGLELREFTTAGVEVLPAIPVEAGANNDTDLDFNPVAITLGVTNVPAGSLIAFNGDSLKVQASNKDTGVSIAEVSAIVDLQGGFVMPATGELYGVDWSNDEIAEIAGSDGHVVRSFSIHPPGSPAFGIFYGDVEYCPADHQVVIGGTEYSVLRFLTLSGSWQGDLDLTGLGIGVGEIGGLALNEATGHLWIAGRSGTVWELSGVCNSFTLFIDGFESANTGNWSLAVP